MSGRCIKCDGKIHKIKEVITEDNELILDGLCSSCLGFFDYDGIDDGDYAHEEWSNMDRDTLDNIVGDQDVEYDDNER